MDVRLMIQSTPNPNALKFVLSTPVKAAENYTYKPDSNFDSNPLAKAIFDISSHVKEVYFFDNYITVTQNGDADWDELEEKIKAVILERIADHNPDFKVPEVEEVKIEAASNDDPNIAKINEILDQTVRPALQMDGGDIQLVGYNNKTLQVFYQGACGSCPSSTMGTLQAIENILKDQFDPEINVELVEV